MHHIIVDMFTLSLPVAEKILRPVLVYAFLVLLLRVFGKRELAQLNPFDLVVLLSLANTVQNAIIGDDNSVAGGFIGATSLVVMNYLVVRFLFRHRRLDQILEGRPAVLIEDGHVRKDELAKELITVHELQTVCRRQGFNGIHEVERCIIEPGGAFAMTRKTPSEEERKHAELVSALDAIRDQVRRLEESVRTGLRPSAG
jgi:uncharacterized membrane protein YcaP (DUF421 family)